jgi:hypothetical protein
MLPYLTIAGAGNAVGTLRPPLPCVALMGNACRPAELQERRSSTIWAELSLDGPGAGTPPTTRPHEEGLGVHHGAEHRDAALAGPDVALLNNCAAARKTLLKDKQAHRRPPGLKKRGWGPTR